MPGAPVRKVTIFVSSPTDVAPERGRVQAVAAKLNREYGGLVQFETVLWEEHRALFDEIERHALKALPSEPYRYAEWKECRVGFDYHVEVERHYYSVPHPLLRQTVWVRITARTIEVFHRGKRVAAHSASHHGNELPTLYCPNRSSVSAR